MLRHRLGGAVVVALTVLAATVAPAAAGAAPTVIGRKIIGYSVQHRPIVAYHLGDPRVRTVSVLIGQMHGDERAGVTVARTLLHGPRLAGVNLWVVPTMNPDGFVRGTRQNAHRVDLNRNFPYRWTRLSGYNYSGRRPFSEPESRAVWRFLTAVHPRYVVSLHQPLLGVDSGDGGRRDPAFRTRLARNLGLPVKHFACWSECHGSMTRTVTALRRGAAITVEFGYRPASRMLTVRAPRGIVAAMGGRVGG